MKTKQWHTMDPTT